MGAEHLPDARLDTKVTAAAAAASLIGHVAALSVTDTRGGAHRRNNASGETPAMSAKVGEKSGREREPRSTELAQRELASDGKGSRQVGRAMAGRLPPNPRTARIISHNPIVRCCPGTGKQSSD